VEGKVRTASESRVSDCLEAVTAAFECKSSDVASDNKHSTGDLTLCCADSFSVVLG
jgi:hypothetical protein